MGGVITRFFRAMSTEPVTPRFAWRRPLAGFSVIVAVLLALPLGATASHRPLFRVGFSATLFSGVNENDAIAAVRAWAQAIAQTRGIPADPQPKIFRSVAEIGAALTDRAVDCISMTTGEYAALRGLMGGDNIVAGVTSGSITEEYLLLVNYGEAASTS